jgi:hypothetical protein
MFDTLIRFDTLILQTLGQLIISNQGGLDPACQFDQTTENPTNLLNS